jgi:hypothetical protein
MDFSKEPAGPGKAYHYVLHYKDHFSKYTVLRPLKTKEGTPLTGLDSLDCCSCGGGRGAR